MKSRRESFEEMLTQPTPPPSPLNIMQGGLIVGDDYEISGRQLEEMGKIVWKSPFFSRPSEED